MTLAARGGYVYANRASGTPCDQQIFDRDGSAYRATDEDQLRIVAQRYIARFSPDFGA